jgi:hypothetical protein
LLSWLPPPPGSGRDDDVHPQSDQLGGKLRQSFEIARREALLDDEILALDVAELAQLLAKRVKVLPREPIISRGSYEIADARRFSGLLRPRRERPRHGSA